MGRDDDTACGLYNQHVCFQVETAKYDVKLYDVAYSERARGTAGLITARLGKSLGDFNRFLEEPDFPLEEMVKREVEDAITGIKKCLNKN